MVSCEPLEDGDDVVGLLIVEPEQDDTEVTAGRVGAGVTETEVEGDEGALVSDCSSEYGGVGVANEALVGDSVDVMTKRTQRRLDGDGDVSSSLSFTWG